MSKNRKFVTDVGGVCGMFRKRVLHKTLKEMSIERDIPITTLNSFEHGRSSSLLVFYEYLVSCETEKQKNIFKTCICEILDFEYKKGR